MTEDVRRLSNEEASALTDERNDQPMSDELQLPGEGRSTSNPQAMLCDLPSRGLLYPNFHAEAVEVLPIRGGVEKQIAGSKGTLASVIDTLIRHCVLSKGIEIGEWLVNDAYYLLFMLRAYTYGSEYTVRTVCESCGANNEFTFSILEDFEIQRLNPGDEEPFGPIELPVNGDEIYYRLLRRSDEKTLAKIVRQSKSRGRGRARRGNANDSQAGDATYLERLALRIVEINGEELSHHEKLIYLEELHGLDSLEIRDHMDDNDPGIDTRYFEECHNCNYEIDGVLPLTAEFFRPSSKSRSRS